VIAFHLVLKELPQAQFLPLKEKIVLLFHTFVTILLLLTHLCPIFGSLLDAGLLVLFLSTTAFINVICLMLSAYFSGFLTNTQHFLELLVVHQGNVAG
jgi:hypothetical protein